MEETQTLAKNESFSYNWLMNMKRPDKNVDSTDSLQSSLDLEADHSKLTMRCTERSSFHFDLSGVGPTDISVADQMIRNGSLVPLDLINKEKYENESNATPEESASIYPCLNGSSEMVRIQHCHETSYNPTPYSSPIGSPVDILRASYNRSVFGGAKSKSHSFEGTKKPSKKINVLKYIKSLLQFCKKVKEIGLDEVRRVSPRSSHDGAEFRTKSCCSSPLYDSGREHAIREAILHCKSSSRKYMDNFAVDGDEEINK